jgi:hypothetical protein
MEEQAVPGDSRVATVLVTLPVRYRGGAFIVYPPEGGEERNQSAAGRAGTWSGSHTYQTARQRLRRC